MAEIADDGGSSKKGGKKGHGKKQSTRVDMTPMVDLGFLLITFFMLTTTFSKPQAMELNMPDKNEDQNEKTQDIPESHSMTVILGEDNKIFYYFGLPTKVEKPEITDWSATGIRKVIMDKTRELGVNAKGIPNIVIVIKAMDKSNYKNMVDILDEMAITNSKRYAIVDIEPVDIELTKKI